MSQRGKFAMNSVSFHKNNIKQLIIFICLMKGLRFNFEAQSVDNINLPPCSFHGLLAKDMNFEPEVGHCKTDQ
jgi:hypothetical protein